MVPAGFVTAAIDGVGKVAASFGDKAPAAGLSTAADAVTAEEPSSAAVMPTADPEIVALLGTASARAIVIRVGGLVIGRGATRSAEPGVRGVRAPPDKPGSTDDPDEADAGAVVSAASSKGAASPGREIATVTMGLTVLSPVAVGPVSLAATLGGGL